jgi:23S rRNA pseudouridine1911/1915/1917 synthase
MPDAHLLIRLEVTTPGRLDQHLLEALKAQAPTLSRAKLKDAMRAGHVLYRGRPAGASMLLGIGPHEFTIQGWDPSAIACALPAPGGSFLPIVYEDDELLVLHKASGVPSVPHDPLETSTAVNSALAHCPELANMGRAGLEPGLLHRLDTGTSGLLVFAKTQPAFDRLIQAWKTPSVRKIYRAIAPAPCGLKIPQTFHLNMGHDAHSAKRMRVMEASRKIEIRGKALPTLTRLNRVSPVGPLPDHTAAFSDFEIEIETGVMHQIRCTLAHLGSPIAGDTIYGGVTCPRLWLHAWRILLPLSNGTKLWLEAQLPSDWASRTL